MMTRVASVSAGDLDRHAADVAPQHQRDGERYVEDAGQPERQQAVTPHGLYQCEESDVAEYDVKHAAYDLLVGNDPRGEDHAEP